MKLAALHQLSSASLRTLSSSLREGMLAYGWSQAAIQQAAGLQAVEVGCELRELAKTSMTPAQIAVVIDAIVDERETHPDTTQLFDLVLSGPDLPGLPTSDTRAAVRSLVMQAQSEVLIATYAIYDGAQLFEPLAQRVRDVPGLKVTFCVQIGRTTGDLSPSQQIIRRWTADFRTRQWPWTVLPRIYYDPRSLSTMPDQRCSMHAKCIVIDRCMALITSANFTEAAQQRNIEAGVLVKHEPTVQRVVAYFEGLQAQGLLLEVELG